MMEKLSTKAERMVSVAEAAAILGRSKSTVYRMIKSGRLPGARRVPRFVQEPVIDAWTTTK
jgi:predicted DNA-binding transcriptional regulator AlpA